MKYLPPKRTFNYLLLTGCLLFLIRESSFEPLCQKENLTNDKMPYIFIVYFPLMPIEEKPVDFDLAQFYFHVMEAK